MLNYLKPLFEDCELVELRVINERYVTAGVYDNVFFFMKSVEGLKKVGQYCGIYTTLNRPDSKYFTFKNQLSTKTRSVKDQDVTKIHRIPFDFDPIREKNTNSNQYQVELALQSASLLKQWLTQRGWPMPLTAMSGNGAHLQYRCAIKSTPELSQAMTTIYQSLAKMFESQLVTFDQTVANPSRIFRLYQTINRKAPDQFDTPQRLASYEIPQPYYYVTEAKVLALADYLTIKNEQVAHLQQAPQLKSVPGWSQSRGDYRTLDMVSLMTDLGLYKKSLGQGKHAVYCPWMTEHSTTSTCQMTDTIIWECQNRAWPQFHCSHNSCQGKNIVTLIQYVGTAEIINYCKA